jgi:hypothetical protein
MQVDFQRAENVKVFGPFFVDKIMLYVGRVMGYYISCEFRLWAVKDFEPRISRID